MVTGAIAKQAVMRWVAVAAVLLAWMPAGQVSGQFFPLMRRSVQLSMLPQYAGVTLIADTCAVIQINRMPPYCERVYTLPKPDPLVTVEYPAQIARAGWEQVYYKSGLGFDWYTAKQMDLDCYVFRTFVWGINETIVLVVLDHQSMRVMSGGDINYCNRISKSM